MSTPTMLFKVLDANGRSCHGGNLQWPLPTQRADGSWEPGAAVRVKGRLVPCFKGIHLATARQVVEQWMGPRIWVAQWKGELVDAGDKWVAREVRLLYPTAWDDRRARHFACDCAERALGVVAIRHTASVKAIRVARRFADGRCTAEDLAAAGAAAWAAAGDAAGAAAWDAAWAAVRAAAGAAAGDAAWDAAGDAAWDAAWAAACAAAWAAAWAAVRAAAGAAAGDAAWDAAGAAARAAERDWQEARLLYYLQGGPAQ